LTASDQQYDKYQQPYALDVWFGGEHRLIFALMQYEIFVVVIQVMRVVC